MRLSGIIFFILILHWLNTITIVAKEIAKPQKETQDEIDLREFREFKEMREQQRRDGSFPGKDFIHPNDKKLHIFMQGGRGLASTRYEDGKMQFGKAGFVYRMDSSFGIGISVGNNSLDLRSKDKSASLSYAFWLLNAYNAGQSAGTTDTKMINDLLFAKTLDSPVAFFYLSNVFNYRYNTAQIDFNFHFNREGFVDPYFGFGIIGGSCTGIYPCSITGGEIKLGAQLNMDSFFTFFQIQSQIINIKEPGFASFRSQHSIASMGVGIKF